MQRILIVEDDRNIARELKVLLKNANYEVEEIVRFSEGIVNDILRKNVDLILLDMNLPNMDGLSICSKLRETSETPIIFLTGNTTSMDELNCMTRGGDDYVTKPYQAPILLARIAAVLKRIKKNESRDEMQLVHKGVTLDVAAGQLRFGDQKTELSKNELKILYYLFTHTDVIVNRTEMIDYLWDQEVYIDDNTLSVNMTRIRSKLDSIGVSEFIETKRGMGYKI